MRFRSFPSVFTSGIFVLCITMITIFGIFAGFLLIREFWKACITLLVWALLMLFFYHVFFKNQIVLSKVFISESGIKCTIWRQKELFISWEECKDISFAGFSNGKRNLYVIVFSKDIANTSYNWKDIINDRYIVVQVRKSIMVEIFKHIPRERIQHPEILYSWERKKYGFVAQR